MGRSRIDLGEPRGYALDVRDQTRKVCVGHRPANSREPSCQLIAEPLTSYLSFLWHHDPAARDISK